MLLGDFALPNNAHGYPDFTPRRAVNLSFRNRRRLKGMVTTTSDQGSGHSRRGAQARHSMLFHGICFRKSSFEANTGLSRNYLTSHFGRAGVATRLANYENVSRKRCHGISCDLGQADASKSGWILLRRGNTPDRWDFRTTEKSSVVRLFAKGFLRSARKTSRDTTGCKVRKSHFGPDGSNVSQDHN